MTDVCQRCGKQPVTRPFRKFCSAACQDSYQRAQAALRKAALESRPIARRTYRYYPKGDA